MHAGRPPQQVAATVHVATKTVTKSWPWAWEQGYRETSQCRPAFRTASDEKLGVGLGTRL